MEFGEFLIFRALSTMMSLGLPHITVLSKCDLYPDKEMLESFLSMDNTPLSGPVDLEDEAHIRSFRQNQGDIEKTFDDASLKNSKIEMESQKISFPRKYQNLSKSIRQIVTDYNLVSLLKLDVSELDSMHDVMHHADWCIGYGEDKESNEKDIEEVERRMGNISLGDM